MTPRWMLVDGYSVLHFWPQLRKLAGRSLQLQREALITVLQQFGDATGQKMTVVFDGYAAKHKPDKNAPTVGIEILFSSAGYTADDVIERFVAQSERPGNIIVVTSDNLERQTVETLGAQSMSCELFEKEVTAALGELAKLVREHSRHTRIGSVGKKFHD